MRFFKRIAGFLGIAGGGGHQIVKDLQEGEGEGEGEGGGVEESSSSLSSSSGSADKVGGGGGGGGGDRSGRHNYQEPDLPRRGFRVPVQVPVDRPHLPPLLVPCSSCDGGVQGLRWYAKRLRVDEDGDVADEFLEEVLPDASLGTDNQQKPLSRLEVKYRTRPAKIKSQMMSPDGKIQQCIEHEGKLQWI